MKKFDWPLLIAAILLALFGVLMVYSSSSIWSMYKFQTPYKYLISQGIFLLCSCIIIIFIQFINPSIYEKYANLFLLIAFILLILVLIPGIGKVRNGSRSWFGIGSLGIQPSEFAKIALILYTAKYLSHNDTHKWDIKKSLGPLFFIICLFFGLIMLEPDFGTACIIVATLIIMIFIAGPNLSFFLKIGFLSLCGIAILIAIAPYRMKRIVAYLNPWSDPLGSGFQIIQSLYAIGPSGLLGKGFGNSVQKNFYLPEPQTDFIFSIIAEEFGFLGVLYIIISFLFIFYRSLKISLNCSNLFYKYTVFGLSFGIILQALLNILVVTGTIPTTGITLPFLSYGGSSLLISMISIGIILSISKSS